MKQEAIECYITIDDDDEAMRLFLRDIGNRHKDLTSIEFIKDLSIEIAEFVSKRADLERDEDIPEPEVFFTKAITHFFPKKLDEDTLNEAFFLLLENVSPSYPTITGFTDIDEGKDFIRAAERATDERRTEIIDALTNTDKKNVIDVADAEVKSLQEQIKQIKEQKAKDIAFIDKKIAIVNLAKEATARAIAITDVQDQAQDMMEKAIAAAQKEAEDNRKKTEADKIARKNEAERRRAELGGLAPPPATPNGGGSAGAGRSWNDHQWPICLFAPLCQFCHYFVFDQLTRREKKRIELTKG